MLANVDDKQNFKVKQFYKYIVPNYNIFPCHTTYLLWSDDPSLARKA